jgi:hypothetical protein
LKTRAIYFCNNNPPLRLITIFNDEPDHVRLLQIVCFAKRFPCNPSAWQKTVSNSSKLKPSTHNSLKKQLIDDFVGDQRGMVWMDLLCHFKLHRESTSHVFGCNQDRFWGRLFFIIIHNVECHLVDCVVHTVCKINIGKREKFPHIF